MANGDTWYQWIDGVSSSIEITDTDGEDTFQLANQSRGQVVSLAPDSYSSIGSGVNNLHIAAGTWIEDVNGSNFADRITGNDLRNWIYTFDGDDTVYAMGGSDIVVTGAGNDAVDAGDGNDYVYGQDGNDTLYGAAGNDMLAGGNGDDVLSGGTDSDTLYGESGNDTLNGQDGDDYLYAGSGNDVINGDAGNDALVGESGDDTMSGGDGADSINGGAGNDIIYGGAKADLFLYNSWSNWDTIKDYEKGVDKFVFWDAISYYQLSFRPWGTGVLIEYGDTHIYVENSSMDAWSPSDFTFVQADSYTKLLAQAPANGWGSASGAANLFGGASGVQVTSANGQALPQTAAQDSLTVAGSAGGRFIFWEYGDVQFNANGAFASLGAGAIGRTTATYAYVDSSGVTQTRIAAFDVVGVNDAPVIGPVTMATGENTPLTFNALAGATDVDVGDTLSIASVEYGGTQTIASGGSIVRKGYSGGTFTIHSNGQTTFDPGTDFDWLLVGQTSQTSLGFSISDGHGGSAYQVMTVTLIGASENPIPPVNPTATAPANGWGQLSTTLGEPGMHFIGVNGTAFNDATPAQDTMTFAGSAGGIFIVWEWGGIQFNANGDFESLGVGAQRQTQISYVIADNAGNQFARTATISVTGVNNAPTAYDSQQSTGENTPLTFNVLNNATDVDSGDVLSVASVEYNGPQAIPAGGSITRAGYSGGKFTVSSNGTVLFDPGADFDWLQVGQTSTTSLIFTISDGHGGLSTKTMSVVVNGASESYVYSPVTNGTAVEDGWGAVSVTSGEAGMSVTKVKGAVFPNTTPGQDHVTVTGDAGGSFTFWEYGDVQFSAGTDFESLGAGQTRVTSATYSVSDAVGTIYSGTVSFTVTGVNDNPVAANIAKTTGENTPLTFNALASATDIDAGDVLSLYSAYTNTNVLVPAGGSITVKGWNGGAFTMQSNGTVTFNPGRDFDYLNSGQTATTTIGYQVSDGHGGLDYKTINVTVNGADETYLSNTQWVNAITLADADVNHNGIEDWREPIATTPTGGGLTPSAYFQTTHADLPNVNTIRILFTPYMVSDSASFAQFKAWVTAAAGAGYYVHLVYADGVSVSNTTIADTRMSATAISEMQSSWQAVLNWVNATPSVSNNVWAYELLNEPEVYRTLTASGYYESGADAVNYANDLVNLHNSVSGWGSKKIMVGGLGASSDFAVLNAAQMSAGDPRTPLDVIHDTFGSQLIWSVHSYPGWYAQDSTAADFIKSWKNQLYPIASDHIMLTETHAQNASVNAVVNGDGSYSLDNQFFRALDWFGENGIGASWWPASFEQNNPSSQALLLGSNGGAITQLSNNIYWANRLWAADPTTQPANAGNDTLVGGSGGVALYGGTGDDMLTGGDGDDYLEGEQGDDVMNGSAGNDTLVSAYGQDTLTGGSGADTFSVWNMGGRATITDFTPGEDKISLVNIPYTSLTFTQNGANTDISYNGSVLITLQNCIDGVNNDASADFNLNLFGRVTATGINQYTAVDDILIGANGNDTLYGGLGDDQLFGGAGNDLLNGSVGTNYLTGGAGADIFVFGGGPDKGVIKTTVTDFQSGVDKIGIGVPFLTYASLTITASGSDALITMPNGADQMRITGAAGHISSSDFRFGI